VATVELVLDCADVEAQAAFWAATLGYERRAGTRRYQALGPPAGETGPLLVLQAGPEPTPPTSRFHLTVLVADVDHDVDRLAGLGARRLGDPVEGYGHRWVPMADPEGNEFRVCSA
jgi:hypothetical protein